MRITSKGYDGIGIVEDSDWLPTGAYWFRGGMSLPAGKTTRRGFRLVGGLCWAGLNEFGEIYLVDGIAWTAPQDAAKFLQQDMFEGFYRRFFTCEAGKDIWANSLRFGGLSNDHRPRPIFVEQFNSDYYRDLILRFLDMNNLKYQKGGIFYKEIGLFLTDPKHEVSPLLESVGFLLNGFELKHRKVFNGKRTS